MWTRTSVIPMLLVLTSAIAAGYHVQANVVNTQSGRPEQSDAAAASRGQSEDVQQLISCLNKERPFKITSWNESVLEDALSNIKVAGAWQSKKARRLGLTVTTQVSYDRVAALFAQCSTYMGPLSAAVFVPLIQDPLKEGNTALTQSNVELLKKETGHIASIFNEIEALSEGCQLDLVLAYEVFDSVEASMLYPINALRNLARMQVRTNLLAHIDVDMLISRTLSLELAAPGKLAELEALTLRKVALVLPAFEPLRRGPSGQAMANQSVACSKNELRKMVLANQEMQQFCGKQYPPAHAPTDYDQWFTSMEPYTVQYKNAYEPWYIGHWDVMPWHDVNYKGYGNNKIVHVASLTYYGFTFQVHPNAWIVHRPHPYTGVRNMVISQGRSLSALPKHALYKKVVWMYQDAKRYMVKGDYEPRVDPNMTACHQRVAWLQPLRTLKGHAVSPLVFR